MPTEPSFEDAIARLDAIVRRLEKGEAPLSESLALFTESTELVKLCTELLDKAEQTVVKLKKGADGPVELPFEAEDSDGV
jgi:exodeoxyribonuclease VII small subunit